MIYEDADTFARSEAYGARAGRERPAGVVLGDSVAARADHGRWLADCPCGAARLVQPGVAFWCADCGHGPVSVSWPADLAEIDAVLDRRATANRNWFPGETVADLLAENAGHGVGA